MRIRLFSCRHGGCLALLAAALLAVSPAAGAETKVRAPISERFQAADVEETPDFQRHVIPLMGRLGCNGRACHGSFQGRGGFQLSLFGYDFNADHAALHDKDSPRVDVEKPTDSLIIQKPTDADMHEGGQRYKLGGWEHHVLLSWLQGGAKSIDEPTKLVELKIIPSELVFDKKGDQVQLQAIAIWADGVQEDVTPLCRFQTNDEQIAQIDENGLVTANEPGDSHLVIFYDNGVVPVPVIRPVTDLAGSRYPQVETSTRIDELVVQKLRKLGVTPSEVASDAEFLRRVSLDITGSLPTPGEVEAFLSDSSPNKRQEKVDALLDTPAYAAWWTTKLCDFTGNNDQQLNNVTPVRGQASKDWYDWIYTRVAENAPYDELASGIVLGQSRRPGQDYLSFCKEMSEMHQEGSDVKYADRPYMEYYWARRDFREVDARAIAFAYSFMGVRIQCAQCHKHPFDQWSKDDFHQFKEFFANVQAVRAPRGKDKEVYDKLMADLGLDGLKGNDARRMLSEKLQEGAVIPFPEISGSQRRPGTRRVEGGGTEPVPSVARLLGGEEVDLNSLDDPREMVMDWLRREDNPYFARAFVNRVWANYFNVGLVEPADDMSLANPPSNKPLLDYLSAGFIASDFDMKWLHREICNSDTYQRSWRPNATNGADQHNFSHSIPRRLPAEIAYDAIQQATAGDAEIAKMHESLDGRAIAIAAASARGNNRGPEYALSVFGRSIRETNCDCDRSAEASLLQTVYLQNDRETLDLIERNRGWVQEMAKRSGSKVSDSSANAAEQLKALTRRMAEMRDKGDKKQLKQMREQMLALRKRVGSAGRPDTTAVQGPVEPEDVVNQAYLRTLSRYPTEDEKTRSLTYLESSENLGKGARDLLWALINTKEFIVNH
ncbi:DUF1549 and DUF1553 domain-containing protein [Lignipirellula cremea]|uniref:BIG2 domain-containing protein n=1 Tax=Lignipirellula cremea TaxID=2528010 RepID=A0A518DZS6_9BACT|nr:DUF1549 and DUF1553 domain-containing protein [Lignipirellula cremea]QDU97342.1 hypothetical protein Pla8534_51880 [Lignipirellula cremea]